MGWGGGKVQNLASIFDPIHIRRAVIQKLYNMQIKCVLKAQIIALCTM